MGAPRYPLVVQVVLRVPSGGLQAAGKEMGVGHGTAALGIPHVEPDTGMLPQLGSSIVHVADDGPVVPPDGRGHDGQPTEEAGVLEAEVESDQATQGRAAEAGAVDAGADAVSGGDEGQQLVDQEVAVLVGFAAAHLPVTGGLPEELRSL